ncbi:hypothetical protein CcI156_14050 [Frankia sp. CcI156]|uniref:Uncharacterized protein n=2 Tax=Frankia TaxID=1854 RepID=Q2J6N8_FRACC|nr:MULTISPECIES: hypothetical protein [Frankia]ABD13054.1 hypothetical protein Francci3_3702 [Frankia casuarinae]ETA01767.1 hypothetical protein CcI6DRAFT_02778 [Frankia sp. CcI6]EYT92437.1 hypothetical protein ThrDRAFT_01886 [Frankia casuarinae]OAA23949.1 hypothetical protein AAY23_104929 [Frankia casuarinae]OHV53594.1 hypothetical protein CgIS1_14160 [Frankia sp. CgIS1]
MNGGLSQRLAELPPETDPGFGSAARALLTGPDATDEALTAAVENPNLAEQTRFNAFYCLQARAWRRKDHRRHRANTDRYQARFGRHPMFFFMQAEYYASLDGDPANLDAALTFALEAVDRLGGVPGVLHLAAEIIADRHERDPDNDPRLLLDAERHVRQAIALSDGHYARYHATHARIATLRGAFASARASIARAIEDEDSTGAEYALRIGDYQLIRSRIQYAQEAERLSARQEEASRELQQIRSQVLEIMGLLAAVIAFITTAANVAAGQPARPAAGLLTLAGGVTLLVFWGFHVLLVGTEPARRRVVAAVVGTILVVAGFLMTEFS